MDFFPLTSDVRDRPIIFQYWLLDLLFMGGLIYSKYIFVMCFFSTNFGSVRAIDKRKSGVNFFANLLPENIFLKVEKLMKKPCGESGLPR